MREFDALAGYPEPKEPRKVGTRTIAHRLIASYRDARFYDGHRDCGYGGLVDDGRWRPIADNMIKEYAPKSVLQIGCDKGFLLAAFARCGINARGIETSRYAIRNGAVPIDSGSPRRLPYGAHSFDLVIAIGVVYTLNLHDAVRCLSEIERVKKDGGHAFITLGAYETEEDYWLLRDWSLLGTTILRPNEWRDVMRHAGYTGDYKFVTAQSLRLTR